MAEYVKAGNPITLTHFILNSQQKHPEATGDFTIILHAFEIASKYVSSKVRAAGLLDLYGMEGSINATGDQVKKLDIIANDAFKTSLARCKKVSVMASEEDPEAIFVQDCNGHYVAVFDPLDGSTNIDVNISIGTIFGIYRRPDPSQPPSQNDVLVQGKTLVAAGYSLYGSATTMFFTTGFGVHGFILDPSSGEFVLTHPDVKIKPKHPIYSVNEGNSIYWDAPTKKYIDSLKNPPAGKKPYSLRYVGSMVADVHRTLIYGGIFMYPGDKNSPSGKLRLLYEANPMAMVIEQAGGKATTGTQRILDIQPAEIHQRVPVFLGSKQDVEELEKFYQENQ
jgi:fructose-1,6-bisphosphatase I